MKSICKVCENPIRLPPGIREGDSVQCSCDAIFFVKRFSCFVEGCNCDGRLGLFFHHEKPFERPFKAKQKDIENFERKWAESERRYALGGMKTAFSDEFILSEFDDSQDPSF